MASRTALGWWGQWDGEQDQGQEQVPSENFPQLSADEVVRQRGSKRGALSSGPHQVEVEGDIPGPGPALPS